MIPPVPRCVWVACSIIFGFGFAVLVWASDAVYATSIVLIVLMAGLLAALFLSGLVWTAAGAWSLVERFRSQGGRHSR